MVLIMHYFDYGSDYRLIDFLVFCFIGWLSSVFDTIL